MTENILEMKNITKEFPGVRALNNVNFQVKEGEIHCLVGENGAGKSTLMKLLSGVYPYGSYQGEIIYKGTEQRFANIRDSEKAGIAIIFQELALIPEMTIYENIYLGHEITKGGVMDWNETIKRSNEMLKKVKLDVNPATKIKDLGVGKQQLIEIAKALSHDVKLLILDEPTSALNEEDAENLFNLLRGLKEHGVTCILISHKLREVMEVGDTITVLRDGQTICTMDNQKEKVSETALIKHMVGREINNIYPKKGHKPTQEVVLEVKNWSVYDKTLGRQILENINFKADKGEIVGIAGLMGSGRTELALSLFGNPKDYRIKGKLIVHGKKVELNSPEKAINSGVAYATEDRKAAGLILIQDVKQNITLANLQKISIRGAVDKNAEVKVAEGYKEDLNIKTPSLEQLVGNLSGGNQQKVSIAKWLFVSPDILILDEPTRGIDVGAKYEIYTIMEGLVSKGMTIIMISSELPEILGMSDRILVISSGQLSGELKVEDATQEKIMYMATM